MLPALIASDVDGTLLDADEKITPRTRNAVRAAVEAGARFVLATGRPPRWVQPVVDALGFEPMAVCANGAVIYDPATDRIVSARTLSADQLGELAEIATRVIPGSGLAVERVGRSAHDAATPQFVSSPGYEHAWLNPDNTEVSVEDLLSAPAIKLLIRKAGARSSDMAAELTKHVGLQGDITYSTNNGLIEVVPLGVSKATGVEEVARPTRSPPGTWWRSVTCQRHTAAALGRPRRGDGQCPSRGGRGGRRGHRAQHRRRGGAGARTLVARAGIERGGVSSGVDRRGEPLELDRLGRRSDSAGNSSGTPSMTLVTVPFSRSKFRVPCWKFCTIHCGSWISPLVGRPSAPRSKPSEAHAL